MCSVCYNVFLLESFILKIEHVKSVIMLFFWKLTRADVRCRVCYNVFILQIVRYRLCNDSFILEIDQKRS